MNLAEARNILTEARKAGRHEDRLIDLKIEEGREKFLEDIRRFVGERISESARKGHHDPRGVNRLGIQAYSKRLPDFALRIVEICKLVYQHFGDEEAKLSMARVLDILHNLVPPHDPALRLHPLRDGRQWRMDKAIRLAERRIEELRLEGKCGRGQVAEATGAPGTKKTWGRIAVEVLGILATVATILGGLRLFGII